MSNQMPAMSAMPICWDQATDPTELRLMVGGDIRAVVTRWSPRDRPDRTDWWAAEGLDGNCRVGLGLFDFPGQACRAAAVHAGVAIAAPAELIAEYGEPSEGAAVAQKAPIAQPPLADRLAALLAEIVDKPLMKVRHPDGSGEIDLLFGSFWPDLNERACILLEEAGH